MQNLVNVLMINAEEFDIYDEMIDILENNQEKDFDTIVNLIIDNLYPPLEIVDDEE